MDVVRASEDLFVEEAVQGEVDGSDWKGLPVIFDEGE
jgi:hypothetical protein